MRRKATDINSKLELLLKEKNDVIKNNEFREQENQEMINEMHALEKHLHVIEEQNKELERELEQFVR
jgi:uncharacterized protein YaaN involved in tellurite resistance